MRTRGSISYAPQVPWIQQATLRENILFGSKFQKARYDAVLRCCALEKDIETLPLGDSTEIGEKGVNLSGGQKQRVSLARAAYSNSDIIIMDDVLSAVDAHVGEHIFCELITGFLKGRTRILVTHQVSLVLPRADLVLCLRAAGDKCSSVEQEDILSRASKFSQPSDQLTSHHYLVDTSRPNQIFSSVAALCHPSELERTLFEDKGYSKDGISEFLSAGEAKGFQCSETTASVLSNRVSGPLSNANTDYVNKCSANIPLDDYMVSPPPNLAHCTPSGLEGRPRSTSGDNIIPNCSYQQLGEVSEQEIEVILFCWCIIFTLMTRMMALDVRKI